MSVALVTEVFTHAPADLTSGERLVLLALAEMSQPQPRPGYAARECRPLSPNTKTGKAGDLERMTGLQSRGLQTALQRLAGRGLETRVALTTGKDGKPLYAFPGARRRYVLPHLTPEGHATASPSGEEGHATASPSMPGRGGHSVAKVRPQRREGEATASPEPELTRRNLPPTPRAVDDNPNNAEADDDLRGTVLLLRSLGETGTERQLRRMARFAVDDPTTEFSASSRLRNDGYRDKVRRAVAVAMAKKSKADEREVKIAPLRAELERAGDLGAECLTFARANVRPADELAIFRAAVFELRQRQRADVAS